MTAQARHVLLVATVKVHNVHEEEIVQDPNVIVAAGVPGFCVNVVARASACSATTAVSAMALCAYMEVVVGHWVWDVLPETAQGRCVTVPATTMTMTMTMVSTLLMM